MTRWIAAMIGVLGCASAPQPVGMELYVEGGRAWGVDRDRGDFVGRTRTSANDLRGGVRLYFDLTGSGAARPEWDDLEELGYAEETADR